VFLKNVSHDHVSSFLARILFYFFPFLPTGDYHFSQISHHLFSNIPWYNQPRSTAILRQLLSSPASTGVELIIPRSGLSSDTLEHFEVHTDGPAGAFVRTRARVEVDGKENVECKEYQLGHYNYDSTPWLRAFWRSFTQCIYIDEVSSQGSETLPSTTRTKEDPYGGGIVFYRDQEGKLGRELGAHD
jgi:hypothetical protein